MTRGNKHPSFDHTKKNPVEHTSRDVRAFEVEKSSQNRFSYGHRKSNVSSELQDRIDDLARIGEDKNPFPQA